MMEQVVVVLALVGLAFSAPQTTGSCYFIQMFGEHVQDFLNLIAEDAGHNLEDMIVQYGENKEFQVSLDYMRSKNFKDFVVQVEALPEFVALDKFLKDKNIDIHAIAAKVENFTRRLVERIDGMIPKPFKGLTSSGVRPAGETLSVVANSDKNNRSSRHATSGRDFTSFIIDSIALLPKRKLAALYDHKMSCDQGEFRSAIKSFHSEEWGQVYRALLSSETFETAVNTLSTNGIEVSLLLVEFAEVFGQT